MYNRMNPQFIVQTENEILRLKQGEITTISETQDTSMILYIKKIIIHIFDQEQYDLIILRIFP